MVKKVHQSHQSTARVLDSKDRDKKGSNTKTADLAPNQRGIPRECEEGSTSNMCLEKWIEFWCTCSWPLGIWLPVWSESWMLATYNRSRRDVPCPRQSSEALFMSQWKDMQVESSHAQYFVHAMHQIATMIWQYKICKITIQEKLKMKINIIYIANYCIYHILSLWWLEYRAEQVFK